MMDAMDGKASRLTVVACPGPIWYGVRISVSTTYPSNQPVMAGRGVADAMFSTVYLSQKCTYLLVFICLVSSYLLPRGMQLIDQLIESCSQSVG